MQTIYGLISEDKYEECRSYIREMVEYVDSTNETMHIAYPAVGACLNSFRELALAHGFTMHFTILNDLAEVPASIYEINTVFGNLLQNAIDEMDQSHADGGKIEVLTVKRGCLFLYDDKIYC